jgi:hypothetical protein
MMIRCLARWQTTRRTQGGTRCCCWRWCRHRCRWHCPHHSRDGRHALLLLLPTLCLLRQWWFVMCPTLLHPLLLLSAQLPLLPVVAQRAGRGPVGGKQDSRRWLRAQARCTRCKPACPGTTTSCWPPMAQGQGANTTRRKHDEERRKHDDEAGSRQHVARRTIIIIRGGHDQAQQGNAQGSRLPRQRPALAH